jgi:tetratricopeptide (TPR) repeat protein
MKSSIIALQESAKQFSAKGEYDKAIAAWKKILSVREDANIYNTIGDLYIKKGSQNEAVVFFMLAANKFRSDGFHEKAMAIYKKILNIVPFEVGVLTALADLYAEKDIVSNSVTYYLKAAEKLSRDGDLDRTIDIYNKILHITPSDINIKTRIADLWLSRGLSEKAANEYAAIALDYLEKEDIDMSIEFFSKAIVADPKNVNSFIGLSNLAEKKNNLKQALDFAAKALLFSHNDKDILLKYVHLAIKTNETQEAKATLSKLIMSAPVDIFYKRLLGSVYIKEGQPHKAWEELQPCIDELLQEQNWNDAYELLEQFKESGSTPVKQRLVTVYRGKSDDESLAGELKNLAKIYEDQGAVQKALGLYVELAELQPGDISIKNKVEELENLLQLRTPLDPEGSSREESEISVQRQPDNDLKETFNDKRAEAEFYANQGLVDEAVSIYEKILAGDPDNIEIRNQIQSLQSALKAVEVSDQSEDDTILKEQSYDLDVDEEDYESHYTAGIEYKQKGLLDEAIREFQIVAKDPGKALLSSKMIALCYMEKGIFVRAIAELNMLLDSMPCDDERGLDIKYELAGAYMKNSDYSRALEIYSEIRTITPDYRDVSHKIDILKDLAEKSAGKQKSKKNRISYI